MILLTAATIAVSFVMPHHGDDSNVFFHMSGGGGDGGGGDDGDGNSDAYAAVAAVADATVNHAVQINGDEYVPEDDSVDTVDAIIVPNVLYRIPKPESGSGCAWAIFAADGQFICLVLDE